MPSTRAGPAGQGRAQPSRGRPLCLQAGDFAAAGGQKSSPPLTAAQAVSPAELTTGLGRLEQAAPKLKQAIVDACAHTVLADNDVTPAEMGLLRAVVITLDCPAPPFLP